MISKALLKVLAAAAAGTYQKFPATWENPEKTCHVFLSVVEGYPCFAFEGTSSGLEWLVDFDAAPVPVPGYPQFGDVHDGINKTVTSIIPKIKAYLDGCKNSCYVVGHSKGAGDALRAAAQLKADGYIVRAVVALEAPRIGGKALRAYMWDMNVVQTATDNIHGPDVVTEVPPWALDMRTPLVLMVPDEYDIATKHRIPAVQDAIDKLEIP